MLRFTGQPRHEKIDIAIPYSAAQDVELVESLIEAIKILVIAIGSSRGQDISSQSDETRWTNEFLIGFSLLAVGEARSMIILLSDRLNRHARVHLRALYEYELRAKLLLEEPKRALIFRDSLAYEMRAMGKQLGQTPEFVESRIAESLGVPDATNIAGTKEKDVFGGSVRNQMKDEIAPGNRYVGTFAWTSLVSHGSILALRELSRETDGATNDLLLRATNDNNGNDVLYHACWLVLWFALMLNRELGVSVIGVDDLTKKIIGANKRLKLISPEQEAKAMKMREEHVRKKGVGSRTGEPPHG
ncbi:MAG: DUF5677 domain-containing protein [Candidatus Tyrphobacter sp.]